MHRFSLSSQTPPGSRPLGQEVCGAGLREQLLAPGARAPWAAGNHRPTPFLTTDVRRPPVLVPVLLWLLRVRHD